jgi:Zn-dependent protease with chaperone function
MDWLAMKWIALSIVFAAGIISSFSQCLSPVFQKYEKDFAQQERQIVSDMIWIAGLNESRWEQFKSQHFEAYFAAEVQKKANLRAQFNQSVSYDIQSCFNKAIQLAHYPYPIELISVDHDYFDMWSLGSAICINEPLIRSLYQTEEEIIAVFLHELAHIKYKDDFYKYCLNTLMDGRSTFYASRWNALLIKFYHLREKRADIMGFESAPHHQYIDARIEFLRRNDFSDEATTHPSSENRIAYLQHLKNQL